MRVKNDERREAFMLIMQVLVRPRLLASWHSTVGLFALPSSTI